MDFRDSNSSWWDHSCFVSCYVGLRSKTAGLSSDKPRLRIRLDGEIMETSRSWTREDFRNREQVIICSATQDHFFFSLVHLNVNNQLICRLFLSTREIVVLSVWQHYSRAECRPDEGWIQTFHTAALWSIYCVRLQRNLFVLGSYRWGKTEKFRLRLPAGQSYYLLILTHLSGSCYSHKLSITPSSRNTLSLRLVWTSKPGHKLRYRLIKDIF